MSGMVPSDSSSLSSSSSFLWCFLCFLWCLCPFTSWILEDSLGFESEGSNGSARDEVSTSNDLLSSFCLDLLVCSSSSSSAVSFFSSAAFLSWASAACFFSSSEAAALASFLISSLLLLESRDWPRLSKLVSSSFEVSMLMSYSLVFLASDGDFCAFSF